MQEYLWDVRVLAAAASLFGAGCVVVDTPPLDGDPTAPDCGLEIAPAPTDSPSVDVCVDGQEVLQARVQNTWAFEDPTAVLFFSVDEPSSVCITVHNGGFNESGDHSQPGHRVWTGAVRLGGEELIGRESLNQTNIVARGRSDVSEGQHEVQIVLYGPRSAFVDVVVRAAPTSVTDPLDIVEGVRGKVAVFGTAAEPSVFNPETSEGVDLSAQVVANLAGDLYRATSDEPPALRTSRRFHLRTTFQIVDDSCQGRRSIETRTPIPLPLRDRVETAVSTTWNLFDQAGNQVGEGVYYYRVHVQLVFGQIAGNHGVVLDEVTSLARVLVADASPPVITIVEPEPDALLGSSEVLVDIVWSDLGSAVEPTSAVLLLDGSDRTSEAFISDMGLVATLTVPDGEHQLDVLVSDIAGNEGSASIPFQTDTSPPQVTFISPAAGSAQARVRFPVDVRLVDAIAGVDPVATIARLEDEPIVGLERDAAGIRGELLAGEGQRRLVISAADQLGNTVTEEVVFTVIARTERIATLESAGGVGPIAYTPPREGHVFLGGKEAAPECLASGDVDEVEALDILRCVLSNSEALLIEDDRLPDSSRLSIVAVSGSSGGYTLIQAVQTYGQFTVHDSTMKVLLKDGRVIQYTGAPYPTDVIPPFDPTAAHSDAGAVLAVAEAARALPWTLLRRQYFVDRDAVVSEFRAPLSTLAARVDERRLELVDVRPVADTSHPTRSATGFVADYSGSLAGLPGPDVNAPTAQQVEFRMRSSEIGDSCFYAFDNGAHHLEGEVLVQHLSFGDFVSPDPTTEEEPGPGFAVGPIPCSQFQPNIQAEMDFGVELERLNAYFWFQDFHRFISDPLTDIRLGSVPEPQFSTIRVIVLDVRDPDDEFLQNAGGWATSYGAPGPTEIYLPRDQTIPGALNLDTMIHEYGHALHFAWGLRATADPETEAGFHAHSVEEGFAQHMVQRYALWRTRQTRGFDDLSTINVGMLSLPPAYDRYNGVAHSDGVLNGERLPLFGSGFRPENFFTRGTSALVHTDVGWGLPLNQQCFRRSGPENQVREIHQCGRLLEYVYWELAWNQTELAYQGVPEGVTIVQSPPSGQTAEQIANAAYSLAIQSITPSRGFRLNDFFLSVQVSYLNSLTAAADIARVDSVLHHHCVGRAHSCEPGASAKLPNSRLPTRFTDKATLATDDQEIRLPADFTANGPDIVVPRGNTDAREPIARLQSAGEAVTTEVDVLSTAFYRVFAAVQTGFSGPAVMTLSVDGGLPSAWSLDEAGFSRWSESGGRYLLGLGTHTFTVTSLLDAVPGEFDVAIDAILVRRCPQAPMCDPTLRCGAVDDGCGGSIQCPPCEARKITSGAAHNCATRTDDLGAGPVETVECWGDNSSGQLGDNLGATSSSAVPVAVELLAAGPSPANPLLQGVIAVAAGQTYSCAVDTTGDVWCWGDNGDGVVVPGAELVLSGQDAIAVDVGISHACAVVSPSPPASNVLCWGPNLDGELGDGGGSSSFGIPVPVDGVVDAVAVSCGGVTVAPGQVYQAHGCALRSDASVECWGSNAFGQLGDGTQAASTTPVGVPVGDVIQLSAGPLRTCALQGDGDVWCWGTIGGFTTSVPQLDVLTNLLGPGFPVIEAGVGFGERCGIFSSVAQDQVACLGDVEPQTTPNLSEFVELDSLAVGFFHGCARTRTYRPPANARADLDNQLVCWGENAAGQLGNATVNDRQAIGLVAKCVAGTEAVAGISSGCGDQPGEAWDGRRCCVTGVTECSELGGRFSASGDRAPISVAGCETPAPGLSWNWTGSLCCRCPLTLGGQPACP